LTFKNIANVKEFVPKRKVVKTEEQFPNLIAVCSEKKKVKNANQLNAQIAPAEKVDPARGKPSAFFVMMPANPTMPADP